MSTSTQSKPLAAGWYVYTEDLCGGLTGPFATALLGLQHIVECRKLIGLDTASAYDRACIVPEFVAERLRAPHVLEDTPAACLKSLRALPA